MSSERTNTELDDAELERLYRKALDRESLTADEASMIWFEQSYLDERMRRYTFLLRELERELVKGRRCAVCANTPEQAVEKGYDCANEC